MTESPRRSHSGTCFAIGEAASWPGPVSSVELSDRRVRFSHRDVMATWRLLPRIATVVLLVLAIGLIVGQLASDPGRFQQDFQSYYYAGRAYRAGQNPYSIEVLSDHAGRSLAVGFVYPPLALPLMLPLSAMHYLHAYFGFLALKLAALVVLLEIWRRRFIHGPFLPFLMFALVSFNMAIYIDFRVGNISIFEQLLLWIALSFLLRGKVKGYLVLVLAASLFKLTLAAFLLLPLVIDPRENWKRSAVAVLGFGSLLIGSVLSSPELGPAFLGSLGGLTERGTVNPSSIAAIMDLLESTEANPALLQPGWMVLYGISSLTVLALAVKVVNSQATGAEARLSLGLVLLFCITYVLISPRMKTYSFALLIVPAYLTLTWSSGGRNRPQVKFDRRVLLRLAVFAGLSSVSLFAYESGSAVGRVLSYSPLIAAYVIWVADLRRVQQFGLFSPADRHEEIGSKRGFPAVAGTGQAKASVNALK